MKKSVSVFLCVSMIGLAVGCGHQTTTPTSSTTPESNAAPAVDGSKFLLNAEPDGAEDVITVRESAQDEEEIVIVGRIGGSENPWVADRAAFSIVDPSLKACSDIPGDTCPYPWDYCCEVDKLPTSTALVRFVDADGNLVKVGARKLLNVKELQTVVIRGQAKRDESGNLTVLANSIFIRKK